MKRMKMADNSQQKRHQVEISTLKISQDLKTRNVKDVKLKTGKRRRVDKETVS